MRLLTLLFFFALGTYSVSAQNEVIGDKKGAYIDFNHTRTYATVVDGDTIPLIYLRPAYKIESRVFANQAQKNKWNRLIRDVKITYPYAKLAGIKLKNYNQLLIGKTDVEKKALMKQVERELKAEFGPKLSDLTTSQGQLLMKLIDRETGNTSYEIVKELRGSFSAFFWQGIAKIFSSDLKKRYDADGDDRKIEDIISLIERGQI
jgi:hypothetical protein